MSEQVATHEATLRGGHDPREMGRRGAAERERRRSARLDEARQALEARLLDVASRMAEIALGEHKARQVEYMACKDVLDRILGQSAQRIETLRLDAFEEEFKRLVGGDE